MAISEPTTKSTKSVVPAADGLEREVDGHLDAAANGTGASVDVPSLNRQLLGTWADVRSQARSLAADPRLHQVPGLPMEEHRKRVSEQLMLLVENGQVHRGFPKSLGGKEDNGGNIAAFEELVTADPSLQIKGGVQWGLFGSAVLHLGTEEHHKSLLPRIMNMEVPGAFAMTETGHGSDVASVGTTATFDVESQENDARPSAPPR